jgi:hypothetical protein
MFDPRLGGRPETQLRFLQDLANLVAPSVYNVYLLRRLRSRAAAVERARVSRELHDGVVQSLHAIAFRLYALRTRSAIPIAEREQELLEVQQLVQNEAANAPSDPSTRALDFDPRHLVDFLGHGHALSSGHRHRPSSFVMWRKKTCRRHAARLPASCVRRSPTCAGTARR